MHRFYLAFLLLFCVALPAAAQGYAPYTWEEGGLSLLYPAGWEEPLPAENAAAQPELRLASAFVDAPELRPPAVPLITLMLIPDDPQAEQDPDLYGLLADALRGLDIAAVGPIPGLLAGQAAVITIGTSADGLLAGMGRATILPDGSVLLVVGRGLAEQRSQISTIFDTVADSIVVGGGMGSTAPGYGVLWHTEGRFDDGEEAFIDLHGLALTPEGHLVTAESLLGLLRFDPETGRLISITPYNLQVDVLPTAVAAAPDGTIYIGDLLCECIRVLRDGLWQRNIGGFGPGAPYSLAVLPDGTLYATDQDEEAVFVRRIGPGLGEDVVLTFEVPLPEQPLLLADRAGRLLVLDDAGGVHWLEGVGFSPLYELPLPYAASAAAVDVNNNLVVAVDGRGLLIYDETGEEVERVGRLVPAAPLPGELVAPSGLVVDASGTLYWVDSDGLSGSVMAMSRAVAPDRVGSTQLRPGLAVQGTLTAAAQRQLWTLNADDGQVLDLRALAEPSSDLDLALRLIAPDGSEAAYSTEGDFLADAHIAGLALRHTGTYVVVVERLAGSGRYDLGASAAVTFELSEGTVELTGHISRVFPAGHWTFSGRAGQVLTFTLLAQSGTLDPILRLYNAAGELLEENDDADDPELGLDSQIVAFRLPLNGSYTLEAARFDGEGRYLLRIEPAAP